MILAASSTSGVIILIASAVISIICGIHMKETDYPYTAKLFYTFSVACIIYAAKQELASRLNNATINIYASLATAAVTIALNINEYITIYQHIRNDDEDVNDKKKDTVYLVLIGIASAILVALVLFLNFMSRSFSQS